MAFPVKYLLTAVLYLHIKEKIPQREEKSKELELDYQPPKPKKLYISPMSHPWRRYEFLKFVRSQPHLSSEFILSIF